MGRESKVRRSMVRTPPAVSRQRAPEAALAGREATAPVAAPAMTARPDVARAQRLGHRVVQTKLTLGPADDPYERQADATARSVVQWLSSSQASESAGGGDATGGGGASVQRQEMDEDPDLLSMKRDSGSQSKSGSQSSSAVEPSSAVQPGNGIQRDSLPDEDPEDLALKRIQRQSFEEEDPEQLSFKRIQRQEVATHGPEGGAVDPGVESAIDSARGGGSALDTSVRGPMEQAFGADFSSVKVHDDSRSHELNRSLASRSFATGSHIFMGQGEYQPASSGGQELLAHELTHVVQQGAAQAKRDDGEG